MFAPVPVRADHNSLYACVAFSLYDDFSETQAIRRRVWERFVDVVFGGSATLTELTHMVDANERDFPPVVAKPEDCPPLAAYYQDRDPSDAANERLRVPLIYHVVKQAREGHADPRMVLPLVCDVTGHCVVLLQRDPHEHYQKVAEFHPTTTTTKPGYIHLLYEFPHYSLMCNQSNHRAIPQRAIKTFRWNGAAYVDGATNSDADLNAYHVRVFMPRQASNSHVCTMEVPDEKRGHCVHHAALDCSFVLPNFHFSLHRKSMPDSLFVFVTKRRAPKEAYEISYWNSNALPVRPAFFLEPDDAELLVVDAPTIAAAIEALRVERQLKGYPFPTK